MSLLTPPPSINDSAFPGENWFFYWKSSPSLWKSKLSECRYKKILVPINWSLHSENGETCDFARLRPETDLSKIYNIAKELGSELHFLLPLGPVPYLPNGGIPYVLARVPSLEDTGCIKTVVDSDGNLIKLHSFFDPRVFKAFSSFVKELSEYFSQAGINSSVWGLNAGILEERNFKSYFKDSSSAFDSSFSRFLATKEDLSLRARESFETELLAKQEFEISVQELYVETAKGELTANWEGVARVAFLGGNPAEVLERTFEQDSLGFYSDSLFSSLSLNLLPSSLLMNEQRRDGVLLKQFNELVMGAYFDQQFSLGIYDQEGQEGQRPLQFFHLMSQDIKAWKSHGLFAFFKKFYQWGYSVWEPTIRAPWDENIHEESIIFLMGKTVTDKIFSQALRYFMSGKRILIDRFELSAELNRKLELFLFENSLEVERVNFHLTIINATLGEGQLIIVNNCKYAATGQSSSLKQTTDLSLHEQSIFWEKLITSKPIRHIVVEDSDIDFYWRYKYPGIGELKFEEIRRLSFYNPTSYKKKLNLHFPKNFALTKILDEYRASVEKHSSQCETQILPGGSVSLEFGLFS